MQFDFYCKTHVKPITSTSSQTMQKLDAAMLFTFQFLRSLNSK